MKVKEISAYKSPGDTVIVKPQVVEVAQGGIHLPEEAQDSSFFEVVETGLNFNSTDIKIGDLVMVAGKGGDRIDLGHTTYWIFPTDMVVAIVER